MGSVVSFFGALLLGIFAPLLGAAADTFGVVPALVGTQVLLLIPTFMLWRKSSFPA